MYEQRKGSSAKREQLLDAAERLMFQRGFWGTSVDDVCAAAAVSKGSFFHYFEGKEQLALAALDQFVGKMVVRVREAVSSRDPKDAYGRICAYCDMVAHAAQAQSAQQGCLIAAFVMETQTEDGEFAKRCSAHFANWIELLRQELATVLAARQPAGAALATQLAQLCICVIEGALILARGRGDPLIVVAAMEHFKRYLGSIVGADPSCSWSVKPSAGGWQGSVSAAPASPVKRRSGASRSGTRFRSRKESPTTR